MAQRLAGALVNLIHDATLKSFWRRKTLWRFLRQHGIAESFLSGWDTTESKRDFLDRLFTKVPNDTNGQKVLLSIARDLGTQDSFPDLIGWENTPKLTEEARAAVANLRAALAKLNEQIVTDRDRQIAQQRFRQLHEEAGRSRSNLAALETRLKVLANDLGSQQAGYAFQDWFYDLASHFEVLHRRPYVTGGRQIDGSVTVTGTTYLIETKFTREQAAAPDIDSFHKKVTDKADNTMGVMVSVSGYSSVAIAEASKPKTPLLLLDHGHLYLILGGIMSLSEVIGRIRRHASQTSEAYLAASLLKQ
ncbi:MAG TPA: hypothetical protein VEB21_11675 [Terriglobales bacterium]|nr:hypothetical protein [Terriglobales bacterium]